MFNCMVQAVVGLRKRAQRVVLGARQPRGEPCLQPPRAGWGKPKFSPLCNFFFLKKKQIMEEELSKEEIIFVISFIFFFLWRMLCSYPPSPSFPVRILGPALSARVYCPHLGANI